MKLITPRTDHEKIALLQQVLSEITAPNSQVPKIPAEITETLANLADRYQHLHLELIEAREAWRHHSLECRAKQRQLEMTLRDTYQQIKRKGRHQAIPASIYESFGLSSQGTQKPETRAMKAPLEQAKSVLAAAQNATNKGFNLLTEPSPSEIERNIEAYRASKEGLTESRNQERQNLAAIKALREEVHQALLKLKLAIRLGSIGQPSHQQRANFEALGFEYQTSRPPQKINAAGDNKGNDANRDTNTATEQRPTCKNAAGDLKRSPKVTHVLAQDTDPGCNEQNDHHDPGRHDQDEHQHPRRHDHPQSHATERHDHHHKRSPKVTHVLTQDTDPGRHDHHPSHATERHDHHQPNAHQQKNNANTRRDNVPCVKTPLATTVAKGPKQHSLGRQSQDNPKNLQTTSRPIFKYHFQKITKSEYPKNSPLKKPLYITKTYNSNNGSKSKNTTSHQP